MSKSKSAFLEGTHKIFQPIIKLMKEKEQKYYKLYSSYYEKFSINI